MAMKSNVWGAFSILRAVGVSHDEVTWWENPLVCENAPSEKLCPQRFEQQQQNNRFGLHVPVFASELRRFASWHIIVWQEQISLCGCKDNFLSNKACITSSLFDISFSLSPLAASLLTSSFQLPGLFSLFFSATLFERIAWTKGFFFLQVSVVLSLVPSVFLLGGGGRAFFFCVKTPAVRPSCFPSQTTCCCNPLGEGEGETTQITNHFQKLRHVLCFLHCFPFFLWPKL